MDQKLRVLIAEDDEALHKVLADVLPYDVTIASDGGECMEVLERESFDLLLLDIMLPKISGVALLRALKERYPELVVVVMTGFADTLRQQVLAMGVDGFIEKPFTRDVVLSAIQKAMGRKRRPQRDA